MPQHETFEPTEDELRSAFDNCSIETLSFERNMEKLDASDFLPRYNRIRIRLRLGSSPRRLPLYLTVRRYGSTLGGENFYTVPFFPDGLEVGETGDFDLLSFDSFNLPFDNISVGMCLFADYKKRRVSAKHIERAKRFVSPAVP
jgi:hypothetical protein